MLTVAQFAHHTADVADRLWVAGVRPSEHVAICKSAHFDICLLACAVARIGAVPVMLSPHLDRATTAALLTRLRGRRCLPTRASSTRPSSTSRWRS